MWCIQKLNQCLFGIDRKGNSYNLKNQWYSDMYQQSKMCTMMHRFHYRYLRHKLNNFPRWLWHYIFQLHTMCILKYQKFLFPHCNSTSTPMLLQFP